MALAKKCDRCNTLFEEPYDENSREINGILTVQIDLDRSDYFTHDMIDLCPDCCEQLNKWLKDKNMRPMIFEHGVMGNSIKE